MNLLSLITVSVITLTLPGFITSNSKNTSAVSNNYKINNGINIGTQEKTKMSAAVFKAQDYCRVELKDFEFDVQFKIVSATVYFTGTNFKNVEKGSINSTSLKPIKEQMQRCAPGSIVIFDDIKVTGPDNTVRPINSLSLLLY